MAELSRVYVWDLLIPDEHVTLRRAEGGSGVAAVFLHATGDWSGRRWQGTFTVDGVTSSSYLSSEWIVHRVSGAESPTLDEADGGKSRWHRFSLRDGPPSESRREP